MRTPRGYASVQPVRLRRLPWPFWLGLAGYVLLTALVASGVLDGVDRHVLHFCQHHRRPSLAAAARDLTELFSPGRDIAWLAVGAGAIAWRRRRPRDFVTAAVTATSMTAVVLVTKASVGRALPDGSRPDHGGYPSGHTAAFLVCWGALALLATANSRQWRTRLLVVLAVGTGLIAAALVYDDFHWLTDTLGSISLGVAVLSVRADGATRPHPEPVPR
jgi:membrane-associated phospholipid phosphatase